MALPLRSGRYRSDFTPQNGTEWDDGAHVKVHKIRTFHNHSGITLVQFDYKDHMGTVVHGLNHGTVPFNFHREHGRVLNQTAVETKVLLEDDEHIVTVTAYVGFCLRQIVFETNKQREIMCGVDLDDPEELRRTEIRDPNLMHEVPCTYHLDDGSTIVGFHGTRGIHYIQEFGVYYSAPQN